MQSGFCKQKTREPPTPQDRSVSVEGEGVRSTVTLVVLCSQCLRAALEDTYVGRDLRDVGILLSWRYMSPLLYGCKSSTVLRMAWFKVNFRYNDISDWSGHLHQSGKETGVFLNAASALAVLILGLGCSLQD